MANGQQTQQQQKQQPPKEEPKEPAKEPAVGKQVLDLLVRRQDEIKKTAAKWLDLDRLFRLSVGVFSKVPQLTLCTPKSLVAAIITCAEWGLEPNTANAHCYLIPRNTTVKKTDGSYSHKEWQASAMMGYRGMIELFRLSGVGEQIWADVVYEGEPFRWRKVTTPDGRFYFDFEHDSSQGSPEGAKILKSYAIAVFKNGMVQGTKIEAWELAKIRAKSEAPNTVWAEWEAEQSKKSAVRRLAKFIPMTDALAEKFAADEVVEGEVLRREEAPQNVRAPAPPPAAPARALVAETYVEGLDFNQRAEPEPVERRDNRPKAEERKADVEHAQKVVEGITGEPDDRDPDDARFYEQMRLADEEQKAKDAAAAAPPAERAPSLEEQFADGDITAKLLAAFAASTTRAELKRYMNLVERAPKEDQARLGTAYFARQKALK